MFALTSPREPVVDERMAPNFPSCSQQRSNNKVIQAFKAKQIAETWFIVNRNDCCSLLSLLRITERKVLFILSLLPRLVLCSELKEAYSSDKKNNIHNIFKRSLKIALNRDSNDTGFNNAWAATSTLERTLFLSYKHHNFFRCDLMHCNHLQTVFFC